MGKKRTNLVPVKKIITRNNKTFETTVLINPNKINSVNKDKAVNVDVIRDSWSKIETIDDLIKVKNEIIKNEDVATKDILKEEFVDFLSNSGVKWDRSEDFAIDYMRALSKTKRMIKEGRFNAHFDGIVQQSPYKSVPKSQARKLCQEIKKQCKNDKELAEALEKYNIAWTKTNHEGINHMHMMMALREAIEEGRETPLSEHMEKNPNYSDSKASSVLQDIIDRADTPEDIIGLVETKEQMDAVKEELKKTKGLNTKEKLKVIFNKYSNGKPKVNTKNPLDYKLGKENFMHDPFKVETYKDTEVNQATEEVKGKTIYINKDILLSQKGKSKKDARAKLDYLFYHELGHIFTSMYTKLNEHILGNPSDIFGKNDIENGKFVSSLKKEDQLGVLWKPNGEESYCDAHALYCTNPERMKKEYPELYNFFNDLSKKVHNYQFILKSMYNQYKEVIGKIAEEQGMDNPYGKDKLSKEHKIAEGKDMMEDFEKALRPNVYEHEIEDIMDLQGFRGVPRVVDSEEFNKIVKQTNFYIERTYGTDKEDVLKAFQKELYEGNWYVDCGTGGASYGQGMYGASIDNMNDEDLVKGLKKEMNMYKRGKYNVVEGMTLDPSAKVLNIVNSKDVKIKFAQMHILKEYEGTDDYEKVKEYIDIRDRVDELLELDNAGQIEDMEAWDKEYDALFERINELGKLADEVDHKENDFIKTLKGHNTSVYAVAMGYDALKVVGRGNSGSYTVVLNRTKLVINKGGSIYGN